MPLTPRQYFPPRLTSCFGKILAVSALSAALFAPPAFADNMADISTLIRAGQFGEALTKVDAALIQTPRDKQLRFMKGVILTEQNKPGEAIVVFTKLTEDFPELPEPYNNLAVLFAAGGQYDKARASLEMAIRTNPTYSTAHENLGDVYAKLASQAYDKALQLDSANTTAKTKLTMVRTLVGNNTGGTNPKTGVAVAAPAPVAAIAAKPAPAPVVVAKLDPKPEPKLEAKPEPKPAPKVEVAKVEAKVEPKPKPEPKPVAKAPVVSADQEEITNVIYSWAKAWAAEDVQAYLAYYASDFEPTNGLSRKAWVQQRQDRIKGNDNITIKIETPKVTVNGSTATAKFQQAYTSKQVRSNAPKTMVMTKQGGKWLIKQERTGS
ncbi:MAG: tetratricopeptide repeat protein [Oxalobacteraceae bacterium]|nr:tetratricopeptide repeat protein [Oxalobacteraceae bacterium]